MARHRWFCERHGLAPCECAPPTPPPPKPVRYYAGYSMGCDCGFHVSLLGVPCRIHCPCGQEWRPEGERPSPAVEMMKAMAEDVMRYEMRSLGQPPSTIEGLEAALPKSAPPPETRCPVHGSWLSMEAPHPHYVHRCVDCLWTTDVEIQHDSVLDLEHLREPALAFFIANLLPDCSLALIGDEPRAFLLRPGKDPEDVTWRLMLATGTETLLPGWANVVAALALHLGHAIRVLRY